MGSASSWTPWTPGRRTTRLPSSSIGPRSSNRQLPHPFPRLVLHRCSGARCVTTAVHVAAVPLHQRAATRRQSAFEACEDVMSEKEPTLDPQTERDRQSEYVK